VLIVLSVYILPYVNTRTLEPAAQRPRSPAAGSRSDVGAEASGSQVQRLVGRDLTFDHRGSAVLFALLSCEFVQETVVCGRIHRNAFASPCARSKPFPVDHLVSILFNEFFRHVDASVVNKAIGLAARKVGPAKRVTAQTFRHSIATHLLRRGTDIHTVQALLGHKDVSTTVLDTHVLPQGGYGVASPLDDLGS
jgi:Phage integrase family